MKTFASPVLPLQQLARQNTHVTLAAKEDALLAGHLEPGTKWIESELRAALQESSASFEEPFLWRLDLSTQRCTLEVMINEEQKSWAFSYEDVANCLNSPETRDQIRRRLRAL